MEPKAYSYIRFSSIKQELGSSLQRQTEASENYAREHNLKLDVGLNMKDLGLSAFHGIHKTKGALGAFLNLVEQGKIPKGSVLIVENLDRLSREQVLDALTQFTSIIQAGIRVVTLMDNMEYSKESIENNWSQLIISITYMAKAYRESKDKSDRLKSAWVFKRDLATRNKRKLTSKCPAWLEPIREKISDSRYVVKGYKVIPERAEVIRLIYDLKLEGHGADKIARDLNRTELWKPQGRKKTEPSWRKSYIVKILYNNRAVIGEYQPHKKVDRKRVPEGDPIPDYFPKIIDVEKFHRVQAFIASNSDVKGKSAGRNDKLSNLFGHMAVCGVCGYPMQFVNKGNTSKGGQYLVCDKELRKIDGGCVSNKIRYQVVEHNILLFCKGLDVSEVVPSDKKRVTERSGLLNRLQAIEGEIADISKRLVNVYKAIETSPSDIRTKHFNTQASIYELKLKKLEKERTDIDERIKKLSNAEKNTEQQLLGIRELMERMADMSEDERLSMRLNLRAQLRQLIDFFRIFTVDNKVVIFFKSGQRRGVNLTTSQIEREAFPYAIFKGIRPKDN